MWLVRTAQNEIAGPYTAEQIKQLISGGSLTLQDEICPANGYWIYLHEKEEVLKILGVQVPRQGTDEITETQTETQTETLTETETATETGTAGESADDAPIPELAEVGEGSTSMISNRALRRFFPNQRQQPGQQKKTAMAGASPIEPQAVIAGHSVERTSVWKGLALGLVAVSVIVVLALLKLLKS